MLSRQKRYYWIKLQVDFFGQKFIKSLRKHAGGEKYVIIYLELCLAAANTGGRLIFEEVADNFEDELALVIDEPVEDIKTTLSFLQHHGLLEQGVADNEYLLTEGAQMIGSESESAERVRRFRENKKLAGIQGSQPSLLQSRVVSCDECDVLSDVTSDVTSDGRDVTENILPSHLQSCDKNENRPMTGAERTKRWRENKLLHCNDSVTRSNTDIEQIQSKNLKNSSNIVSSNFQVVDLLQSIGITNPALSEILLLKPLPAADLIKKYIAESKNKRNPAGFVVKAILDRYPRNTKSKQKTYDPNCPDCHGTGKIVYYIDSDPSKPISTECQCYKKYK